MTRLHITRDTFDVLARCAEEVGARVVDDYVGYDVYQRRMVALYAVHTTELVRFVTTVARAVSTLPVDVARHVNAFLNHLLQVSTYAQDACHARAYYWPYVEVTS